MGNLPEYRRARGPLLCDRVLALLQRDVMQAYSPEELMALLSMAAVKASAKSTEKALNRLIAAGHVVRSSHGRYRAVQPAANAAPATVQDKETRTRLCTFFGLPADATLEAIFDGVSTWFGRFRVAVDGHALDSADVVLSRAVELGRLYGLLCGTLGAPPVTTHEQAIARVAELHSFNAAVRTACNRSSSVSDRDMLEYIRLLADRSRTLDEAQDQLASLRREYAALRETLEETSDLAQRRRTALTTISNILTLAGQDEA